MPEVCSRLYDGVTTTPRERVEHACTWIADNYPAKWLKLVNLCEQAQAKELPRIRRGDLFVLAQQAGMPITECMEFRFDNNLWSVLSRYLILFRPSLARVIFPRECDVDAVDLEALWRDIVNPNTWFMTPTWVEAAVAAREGAL